MWHPCNATDQKSAQPQQNNSSIPWKRLEQVAAGIGELEGEPSSPAALVPS